MSEPTWHEDISMRLRAIERKLAMAGTEPKTATETMIMENHERWLKQIAEQPEPDLPLRVRVAMLDGWENIRRSSDYDEIENPQWVGYRKQQGGTAFGVIPDYPNNLVAAMGALEEYCRNGSCYSEVTIHSDGTAKDNYFCKISQYGSTGDEYWEIKRAETLPQAICEAIVAHAEQTGGKDEH